MASAPSNKTPTEPVQPQPRKLRYEEPKIDLSRLPSAAQSASAKDLPEPPKNPSASTVRRLMWDLKQVSLNPLPDVVAAPVGDNLFYWHGNIRGPAGSYWAKAILHLSLHFPLDYPRSPPAVSLLTPIPHPNVLGDTICLDLLTIKSSDKPNGWTSAYTVHSILLQLQSFLFEKNNSNDETALRQALDKAAGYSCNHCQHRPRLPVPSFPFDDPAMNLERAFINLKTEEELKKEEFSCFFTRATIDRAIIGFGLMIKKNQRTRRISAITSYLSPLSINAFFHHHVRKSAMNEEFAYWMPYVINAAHGKRALHYIERSISQMVKGDPRSFTPAMAVDVLPVMITSFIVSMMKGSTHASEAALNGFTAVYHIMLLLLEAHPTIGTIADERLKTFISDKAKRHKDVVPALGDVLPLLLVSSVTWPELREAYVDENTDRDVFWVLGSYADIEKDAPEDRRAKWLAATAVGKRLLAFQIYFIDKFARPAPKQPHKTIKEMLDKQWGQPTATQVAALQAFAKQTQELNTWEALWDLIGSPRLNVEQWDARLLAAIKSSEARHYHGKRAGAVQPDVHARNTAAAHLEILKSLAAGAPPGDKAAVVPLRDDEVAWKAKSASTFHITELKAYKTWRECFCTEALLSFLSMFEQYPDFDAFYSLLNHAGPHVRSLTVDWWLPVRVKSKYYWVSALLERLPHLESLTLNNSMNKAAFLLAAAKKLARGLSYVKKTLTSLAFDGVSLAADGVLQALCPALETLQLRTLKLSNHASVGEHASEIGRYISGAKSLEELVLTSGCFPTPTIQYEGLRAIAAAMVFNTSVKKIDLNASLVGWQGLGDLFHALAAHPKIEELDISSIPMAVRQEPAAMPQIAKTQAALVALLTKTKSLRKINLYKSPVLVQQLLTADVWAALAHNTTVTHFDAAYTNFGRTLNVDTARTGLAVVFLHNTTLRSLNLDAAYLTSDVVRELAFKAKGSKFALQEFSLQQSISSGPNADALGALIGNLHSIHTLSLNQSTFDVDSVIQSARQKGQKCPSRQGAMRIPAAEALGAALAHLSHLKSLSLAKCKLQEAGMRPIALSLAKCPALTFLDLSKNYVGNADAIAHLIMSTSSIRELDLTDNAFKVKGARTLAEALRKNSSLEHLHLGVNGFKNKGTTALLPALKAHTRLHTVDLSANFITDETGVEVLKVALERKWKELSLGGNQFSEKAIKQVEALAKDSALDFDLLTHAKRVSSENLVGTVYMKTEAKMTQANVTKFFTKHSCGAIKSVSIYNKRVKARRGTNVICYAFVTFVDPNSVALAVDIGAAKATLFENDDINAIAQAGPSET